MADILIIEDHEPVRSVLEEILRDEHHEVRAASDGETGLTLARERCPDLVFLDLKMPGVEGAEVLRELKADPETQRAKVVIVTAGAEAEREEILALGAEDYFTKPFSPLAILDLVERLTNEAPG
jgi:CheY-like chemotaxis protein